MSCTPDMGDVEDHCVHGFRWGSGPSFTRDCLDWNWGFDKLLMVFFLGCCLRDARKLRGVGNLLH